LLPCHSWLKLLRRSMRPTELSNLGQTSSHSRPIYCDHHCFASVPTSSFQHSHSFSHHFFPTHSSLISHLIHQSSIIRIMQALHPIKFSTSHHWAISHHSSGAPNAACLQIQSLQSAQSSSLSFPNSPLSKANQAKVGGSNFPNLSTPWSRAKVPHSFGGPAIQGPPIQARQGFSFIPIQGWELLPFFPFSGHFFNFRASLLFNLPKGFHFSRNNFDFLFSLYYLGGLN